MTNRFMLTLVAVLALMACTDKDSNKDYTLFVNPFIGTGGHGHTFPGAVLPNGMVQLSPDTRTQGWDACSGYYYRDTTLLGFSHRHLSGTGMTDFADILFTPYLGNLIQEADTLDVYYPIGFSHKHEIAEPAFYQVRLDNDIEVKLTASTRVGFHEYLFPAQPASIVVDLHHNLHNQKVLESGLEIINDYEIRGMRLTEGWSKRDYIYFHAIFDKPFTAQLYNENKKVGSSQVESQNVKGVFLFLSDTVKVKVGISAVDYAGAYHNLQSEIPHWDMLQVKKEGQQAWNDKLSLIDVQGGTPDEQEIFYTSLYHAYIHPSVYSDVDGRYRGQDLGIHQLDSLDNYYTVFSLWDTFRAQLPLVSLIDPDMTNEFINSLLLKYQQGGLLPMWDLAGCYTGTMIGAHATSAIADAYTKGIRNYDIQLAYEAMKRSIPYDTTGVIVHHPAIWEWLMTKGKLYNDEIGFIPADKDVIFSVSRALEYAYNDWALACVALDMGKMDDYKLLMKNAQKYKQYYDAQTGFMRPLNSAGEFIEPFNPSLSDHMTSPYCEGNAWQWSWFVPHDPKGLMELMGGKQEFEQKLDSLFHTTAKVEGEDASADITGLIGQYAHGNEPSHHVVFLYNYTDNTYKTQELVDQILREQYTTQPDGLSGNEDCGQMSAWYIMSALGIYQVAPGDPVYTFSRPLFDQAQIQMQNGKVLMIIAENNSKENKYISKVYFDDELLVSPFIEHQRLVEGGILKFVMTNNIENSFSFNSF